MLGNTSLDLCQVGDIPLPRRGERRFSKHGGKGSLLDVFPRTEGLDIHGVPPKHTNASCSPALLLKCSAPMLLLICRSQVLLTKPKGQRGTAVMPGELGRVKAGQDKLYPFRRDKI